MKSGPFLGTATPCTQGVQLSVYCLRREGTPHGHTGKMSAFAVGQRVKVSGKDGVGTVRYIGETDFKEGTWVGIEMDEPIGNNDGTVQGKQYFACGPQHGVMAKPENVRSAVPSRRASGDGASRLPSAGGAPVASTGRPAVGTRPGAAGAGAASSRAAGAGRGGASDRDPIRLDDDDDEPPRRAGRASPAAPRT